MSKIAKYLNGHVLGEVSARESRLNEFSKDRSILKIKPDLVMFPRLTDDIRKIMRFSWQLAEKGHIFGVTVRGYGGSTDGSSLGSGIVVDVSRHMNQIFELDLKMKKVRVAAGTNFSELNLALATQAMTILQAPAGERLTVGGAIAMNLPAEKYKYGEFSKAVDKLEVILSNGETIQTGRISKRELNRMIGLQTFEAEIYRKVDAIIEENSEVISQIQEDASYGYSGISKVKSADGSFDLTPLFFGSGGTLGVISEVILNTEFVIDETEFVVVSFQDRDDARDFIDLTQKIQPSILEMYDGKMFESAVSAGKKYDFYIDRVEKKLKTKMVLVIGISDRTARRRISSAKKIMKMTEKFQGATVWAPDGDDRKSAAEIEAIRDVREALRARGGINREEISPIQGVYIPLERFEEFYLNLQKIALKHSIPAPIQGSALSNVFEILAEFDFTKVSDRQKSVKFIADLAVILAKVDGEFGYGAGEGRLYGEFVKNEIGEDLERIYHEIRNIFDPYGILNPGVKSENALKDLLKNVKTGK